ncbi:NAD(P)/FAD-dependent oxidoreductase [Lentzea sp.]|uniref:NAD(P)/FAD-dependent oxidoreductase n=1 Tax=Lentzea sp. TaxID=56099 RepID=UPI002ED0FEBC
MREGTDVVILGAGIAGTVLAAVLARGGARVEVLDAGRHPRFAIGESTIPHTSTLFRLLAERYDVPEIKHLATFHGARAHVSANHGIKRGFNFHWHEPGARQDPELAHQLPIPSIMHTETHFLRADLDHWVMRVARKYGAVVREGVRVTGVGLGESGVTVTTDDGATVRARFIVDAGGFRSVLASQLDLRDEPCRFRHHSRSMFTHMEGVVPWERIAACNPGPVRGSQSTLHHVFDGGWIWVIPFGNHPRAGSDLVSVGMTVDPRKHPRRDVPAGQEFREFISAFRTSATSSRTPAPPATGSPPAASSTRRRARPATGGRSRCTPPGSSTRCSPAVCRSPWTGSTRSPGACWTHCGRTTSPSSGSLPSNG